LSDYFHWQGEDLILFVKVNARSSVNKIEPNTTHLKVKITAPPINGAANKHLMTLLAKAFSVAPSKVTIVKGANQSLKKIKITQPACLPDYIAR
jgi:uncharacterized protein (TIGR00251 family)